MGNDTETLPSLPPCQLELETCFISVILQGEEHLLPSVAEPPAFVPLS